MTTRLVHAWRAMNPDQRLAVLASLAMLVTMFFPWYSLQSVRKGEINSHTINAFGDISFVEAAVFLVAVAVIVAIVARVEGREFHLPGGDGTIVLIAGTWAGLLIFYRVFDRPAGHGYPVGIEWGFFLAFVATDTLAYAGWRIRAGERGQPPLSRTRERRHARDPDREQATRIASDDDDFDVGSRRPRDEREQREARSPVPARPRPAPASEPPASSAGEAQSPRERSRYPPAPAQQMSFEDTPPRED